MAFTPNLPKRFCFYCAIAKNEKVRLTIISRSSMEIDRCRKTNWGEGGYVCPCCGLQLPAAVFELVNERMGIIRLDKCT
jgi:hypothetical protein